MFLSRENSAFAGPDICELADIMYPMLRPVFFPGIPDRLNEPLHHVIIEQTISADDTPGMGTTLALYLNNVDFPQDVPNSWVEALEEIPGCNSYKVNYEDLLRIRSAAVLRKLSFDQSCPIC